MGKLKKHQQNNNYLLVKLSSSEDDEFLLSLWECSFKNNPLTRCYSPNVSTSLKKPFQRHPLNHTVCLHNKERTEHKVLYWFHTLSLPCPVRVLEGHGSACCSASTHLTWMNDWLTNCCGTQGCPEDVTQPSTGAGQILWCAINHQKNCQQYSPICDYYSLSCDEVFLCATHTIRRAYESNEGR